MTDQIPIEPALWDLVPEYLERRQCDLVNLRTALEGNDLVTLQSVGHKLRGSGASYGFRRISQLGRDLEEAAAKGDTTIARSRIEELARHLEAVEPVPESAVEQVPESS